LRIVSGLRQDQLQQLQQLNFVINFLCRFPAHIKMGGKLCRISPGSAIPVFNFSERGEAGGLKDSPLQAAIDPAPVPHPVCSEPLRQIGKRD